MTSPANPPPATPTGKHASAAPDADDRGGPSGNLRGILAITASMACFNTNDMMVKLASDDLPTGQIVFLRGLFCSAILGLLVWRIGAFRLRFGAEARRPVLLRTVGDAVSTILFLSALFKLPLATATAILQSLPIVMTFVSAMFFGEIVRWRRWAAVIVGFVGVLMIIQPGGEGFNAYSLLAVAALLFITLRDLATRFIPRRLPSVLVSFYGSLAVTATGGLLSLGEEWAAVSTTDLALLAGAAIFLTGGYVFIVEAMRSGEISTVAPFRYTIILFALVYSWAIWGEVPNPLALAGIGLVVASGLYVFRREGRLRRRPARTPPGRASLSPPE